MRFLASRAGQQNSPASTRRARWCCCCRGCPAKRSSRRSWRAGSGGASTTRSRARPHQASACSTARCPSNSSPGSSTITASGWGRGGGQGPPCPLVGATSMRPCSPSMRPCSPNSPTTRCAGRLRPRRLRPGKGGAAALGAVPAGLGARGPAHASARRLARGGGRQDTRALDRKPPQDPVSRVWAWDGRGGACGRVFLKSPCTRQGAAVPPAGGCPVPCCSTARRAPSAQACSLM